MISALFSVFFVSTLVSSSLGQDDANCLPGTWLPEGSDVRMCDSPGYDYDGSLIPDCDAFHGQVNTTSFFHIHEYGEAGQLDVTICRLRALLDVQPRGPLPDAMCCLQHQPQRLS